MALKSRHRLSPLLVPAIKNVCVSMRLSDIGKILIKRVKSRAEAAQRLGQHLGVPVFLLFLLNVTKPEHEWEEFIRNAVSPCDVELRKSVVVISSCGVFVDDHRCPESTSLRSRQHGVSGQTAGSVWANVVVCPAHGHAQLCLFDVLSVPTCTFPEWPFTSGAAAGHGASCGARVTLCTPTTSGCRSRCWRGDAVTAITHFPKEQRGGPDPHPALLSNQLQP
ncbi:prokineticin-2 isoform X4 [Cygnus atratus]|uniref:prokineticin-2 isoform X4 n=1 Tax=Cygnus atratus TaxID=8868 RepID=UPI0015D60D1E|nr:prokineticin-2 isoform X4 [Cygnus atratus]